MGYGSDADGKEIVAVKQNRYNYYAIRFVAPYSGHYNYKINICNRRLLQRLLSLELELLLSSIL